MGRGKRQTQSGDDYLNPPEPRNKKIHIHAEVNSKDGLHTIEFDALPWFKIASDRYLYNLYGIDYGGDYASEEVAEWFAKHKNRRDIAEIVNGKSGFECFVNCEEAEAWIKKHRPILLAEETVPCDNCGTIVLAGEGNYYPYLDDPEERLCKSCYKTIMGDTLAQDWEDALQESLIRAADRPLVIPKSRGRRSPLS